MNIELTKRDIELLKSALMFRLRVEAQDIPWKYEAELTELLDYIEEHEQIRNNK